MPNPTIHFLYGWRTKKIIAHVFSTNEQAVQANFPYDYMEGPCHLSQN